MSAPEYCLPRVAAGSPRARDARPVRVGRDIEGRARLVETVFGNDALGEQVLGAVEIGLRLGELRFEAGDLRVERIHLQGELLVADVAMTWPCST